MILLFNDLNRRFDNIIKLRLYWRVLLFLLISLKFVKNL